MTPSNPDNQNPLIYRICDALGVFHIVAPVNHTHAQSEIEGLAAALVEKANAIPAGFPSGAIVIAGTSGEIARSNKTITDLLNAIAAKQDALTFDTTPTAGSTNPVTSGGVKTALDGKANIIHTHVASQVEGVMPYYLTYEGDSINLDAILTDPHTMQRLIIENADGSPLDIAAGLFTSPTEQLVIHINNTPELFIVDPGDYAMVTIFKVDRGETTHGHDVCYFAYVEGIFNYES